MIWTHEQVLAAWRRLGFCVARSSLDFVCCLPIGHEGPHLARHASGLVADTWCDR